jgi:hypothetical protein
MNVSGSGCEYEDGDGILIEVKYTYTNATLQLPPVRGGLGGFYVWKSYDERDIAQSLRSKKERSLRSLRTNGASGLLTSHGAPGLKGLQTPF